MALFDELHQAAWTREREKFFCALALRDNLGITDWIRAGKVADGIMACHDAFMTDLARWVEENNVKLRHVPAAIPLLSMVIAVMAADAPEDTKTPEQDEE